MQPLACVQHRLTVSRMQVRRPELQGLEPGFRSCGTPKSRRPGRRSRCCLRRSPLGRTRGWRARRRRQTRLAALQDQLVALPGERVVRTCATSRNCLTSVSDQSRSACRALKPERRRSAAPQRERRHKTDLMPCSGRIRVDCGSAGMSPRKKWQSCGPSAIVLDSRDLLLAHRLRRAQFVAAQ